MSAFYSVAGSQAQFRSETFEIRRPAGMGYVLCHNLETGEAKTLRIEDLKPVVTTELATSQLSLLPDDSKYLAEAKRRLMIIEPLLSKSARTDKAKIARAKQFGVSKSSIERWIRRFQNDERLSGLVPRPNRGGKGQRRILREVVSIIETTIEEFYLRPQRPSATATCEEVKYRCEVAKLPSPSPSTVRRYIDDLSETLKLDRRGNKKVVRDRYTARPGTFREAECPLAIIEIDHCRLDIEVVTDDAERAPMGRPWLTLALDTFSRMVFGRYMAMDAPDSAAVGICIQHGVLPKKAELERLGVEGEWPIYGFPTMIHTDNGSDFLGKTLHRAAEEYNIHLTRRPVGDPHFGGHIERFFRTLNEELHGLPGSTFSNPTKRAEYASRKQAAFTFNELQQYITDWIVNTYHRRTHRTISMSPLRKLDLGLNGDGESLPHGPLGLPTDPARFRLDFLPYFERKIEHYGVTIEGMHYFADILRSYFTDGKRFGRRQDYLFRRDPDDISLIYFLDPNTNSYHPIPYRDINGAPMSAVELRQAKKDARKFVNSAHDDRAIFEARQHRQELERNAKQKTNRARRSRRSIIENVELPTSVPVLDSEPLNMTDLEDVEPFSDLRTTHV